MGVCYIVASMKTEYQITRQPGDLVIAADGGYAQKLGCDPDVVIGDFDSLGFIPEGDNVKVYPKQKDDTDMMLAVKLGLKKGYREFVLLGGIGGRFDHMMANIQTLAYLHSHGAKGMLTSGERDIYLVGHSAQMSGGARTAAMGTISFSEETSGMLSVFSYGEKAQQVTISGAEYEIENALLEDCFPLGVSNSFVGKEVTISVGEGRLLIVHEKNGA